MKRKQKSIIPPELWVWHGSAAHFILAHRCRFHLTTKIGKYFVSTVGECFNRLEATGKPEEIGCERTYETMVFLADRECTCGCGMPSTSSWSSLDSDGYNDAKSANDGHYAMCKKVAGWNHSNEPC